MQYNSLNKKAGTLSVCMIVKNEEACLERCLASIVTVLDELIIVDTGSTDSTQEIALRYNAHVIESVWKDDFSSARNSSLENATGAWILWLDADDVVPSESLPLINEFKQRAPDRVYSFIVRNERPGNTGSEFTQARMFPNMPELRFERSIHEQMMPSALRIGLRLEPTAIIVEHHGYADPATLRKKSERNIALLLKEYPRIAPDPVMATEIADAFWLIENNTVAAEWYAKVIAMCGVNPAMPALVSQAYYGLGNIANKQEQFAMAIEYFDRALLLASWRSDVLYSKAVALELSGDWRGAAATLGTITEIEPVAGQVGVDFRSARIKAYLRLFRIYTERRCFDEIERVIAVTADRVGMRPEIQTSIGKYYIVVGRLMEALQAFETSLHLRRNGNIDAFIGLCCIYYHAHRYDVITTTLQGLDALYRTNDRYKTVRKLFCNDSTTLDTATFATNYAILQRDFFGMLPKNKI